MFQLKKKNNLPTTSKLGGRPSIYKFVIFAVGVVGFFNLLLCQNSQTKHHTLM